MLAPSLLLTASPEDASVLTPVTVTAVRRRRGARRQDGERRGRVARSRRRVADGDADDWSGITVTSQHAISESGLLRRRR